MRNAPNLPPLDGLRCSLGPSILRAETAALAALAVVSAAWLPLEVATLEH